MHGIAFNSIRQKNESENQLKVIECVCGERVEQQLEFEFNRQLFRFDTRHFNSNRQAFSIQGKLIVAFDFSKEESHGD